MQNFIHDYLAQNGGVASGQELRLVATQNQIRTAADAGRIRRIRIGWYALPEAEGELVRAVTAGGVMSCHSALRAAGVWTPLDDRLHVRSRPTSTVPHGVASCGNKATARLPMKRACDPLAVAILAAAHCFDRESWVAAVESARHLKLLPDEQLVWVAKKLPRTQRLWLGWVAKSESGSESLVRQRLRVKRYRCRAQVSVEGVGRVDLVVGRWLVIEVDSKAHHTGVERYASDRLRDLRLATLGYLTVRLTWEQVMLKWDETWLMLQTLLRDGAHLRPHVRQRVS